MLKQVIFTALFSFCLAKVLATKFTVTLNTESNTDSSHFSSQLNKEPLEVHVDTETLTPELLKKFSQATNIFFSDIPGSPKIFKANDDLDFDEDYYFDEDEGDEEENNEFRTLLSNILDEPREYIDAIQKHRRFSDVRQILEEIMDDLPDDDLFEDHYKFDQGYEAFCEECENKNSANLHIARAMDINTDNKIESLSLNSHKIINVTRAIDTTSVTFECSTTTVSFSVSKTETPTRVFTSPMAVEATRNATFTPAVSNATAATSGQLQSGATYLMPATMLLSSIVSFIFFMQA
ncbi:hypothetical protein KAFR_0G01940 [Kazachstania africana CBS 2517]|uniref:Uncharacterized protein n=1 Tax=Kazachstania africana (strain ATCC 22294 / BCRC 22015 / CBS 2517 / CECT 1963 / NBRC 1671 / NRRL Y-8276) TaxID=1071382 RepID=H2AXX8_KAZAF|nr:hypothetical protein KAFR_0G01940 [Kazachstania africana CBS 2517]CCF59228.1 hypothetical protein KAFR_0G01940 [Kazachstania africana CBS 2517]